MSLIQLVVQIGNPLTRSHWFRVLVFRQFGEQRIIRGSSGIRDLQVTKRPQRTSGSQRASPMG